MRKQKIEHNWVQNFGQRRRNCPVPRRNCSIPRRIAGRDGNERKAVLLAMSRVLVTQASSSKRERERECRTLYFFPSKLPPTLDEKKRRSPDLLSSFSLLSVASRHAAAAADGAHGRGDEDDGANCDRDATSSRNWESVGATASSAPLPKNRAAMAVVVLLLFLHGHVLSCPWQQHQPHRGQPDVVARRARGDASLGKGQRRAGDGERRQRRRR